MVNSYLSVRNLSVRYGSFVALQDVCIDIEEGEFVCFLGPSGCGKTTLLRAIAGLTPQADGQIWQAGQDISRLAVGQRDFGIVFQSYALFPNMTVAGNVGYSLAADRSLSRAERFSRVRELLELVGLPDSAERYPAQLSGGQQQRVALARALCNSPGLLLLDEPLSALDAIVRQRLRLEIKALQSRLGITTILVTHDQEEALTMADRIVVMSNGRIEQTGTPQEIYYQPASPFVASFIGAMNMFEAEVAPDRSLAVAGLALSPGELDGSLRPGGRVTVCVRPEDIRLVLPGEAAENSLEVSIAAVEFLGSFFRCETKPVADCGPALTIILPASVVQDSELSSGTTIRISIPPSKFRMFAGETSSTTNGKGKETL